MHMQTGTLLYKRGISMEIKGTWQDKKYIQKIGYGIGQYYEKTKAELSKIIKLDYLCDRKWEGNSEKEHDGIAIIRKSELKQYEGALVIVFTGNACVYQSIQSDLNKMGMDYIHVDKILGLGRGLTGKMLKEIFSGGIYEDKWNNKIYFDESLPDNIIVSFQGHGNILQIAPNIIVGSLYVRFGNNGFCSIGENTEIFGAEFAVADAKIQIGRDCLLANGVIIRTHDAHHIFDMETHRRINVSKDVRIGDNVWIAYRATLLGGATVGTGSIVGTNAVTSGEFGNHLIIAGSPARVIKENICWSRDDTEYFNRKVIEECISQAALKYMN